MVLLLVVMSWWQQLDLDVHIQLSLAAQKSDYIPLIGTFSFNKIGRSFPHKVHDGARALEQASVGLFPVLKFRAGCLRVPLMRGEIRSSCLRLLSVM